MCSDIIKAETLPASSVDVITPVKKKKGLLLAKLIPVQKPSKPYF